MAGGELREILKAIGRLEVKVGAISQRLDEQDKRTDRFWDQDWPALEKRIGMMEISIHALELSSVRTEGVPATVLLHTERLDRLDQFAWRAAAFAGALALVGSLAGTIISGVIGI
jgi:hypothetical protein